MILPEIGRKRPNDYNSPYNDKMFNKNKTHMMWKALEGEESRTISHIDQSRLRYNEFDYVKRVTMKEFMKE